MPQLDSPLPRIPKPARKGTAKSDDHWKNLKMVKPNAINDVLVRIHAINVRSLASRVRSAASRVDVSSR